MTTYTVTQEQLDVAVELLVTTLHLVPQGESELFKDTNNAIHMLRNLQPNTQEPVAHVSRIAENGRADINWLQGVRVGDKLFTHPAHVIK